MPSGRPDSREAARERDGGEARDVAREAQPDVGAVHRLALPLGHRRTAARAAAAGIGTVGATTKSTSRTSPSSRPGPARAGAAPGRSRRQGRRSRSSGLAQLGGVLGGAGREVVGVVRRRLGQQHRVEDGLVAGPAWGSPRDERRPGPPGSRRPARTAVSTSGSTSSKKWFVGTPTRTPARSPGLAGSSALCRPAGRRRRPGPHLEHRRHVGDGPTDRTDVVEGPRQRYDTAARDPPCVGLRPTTPHRAAGMRIEPAVSVPMARLHCRADTAAADRRSTRRRPCAGVPGFAVPGVDAPYANWSCASSPRRSRPPPADVATASASASATARAQRRPRFGRRAGRPRGP